MEPPRSTPEEPAPGLTVGLIGLAKNTLALMMSRLELAALELSEIRTNLLRFLMISALGVVALWFATASWTMLIVVLAWPALGWKILLILALGFSGLAGAALYFLRSHLRQHKLAMPATMAELRADRDALL